MAHAITKRGRLGVAGRVPTTRAPVPHQPRIVSLVTRPHVFQIGPMGLIQPDITSVWDTHLIYHNITQYGILGLVVNLSII